MPSVVRAATSRKPRADAERNRRRLLDAARLAFADQGSAVTLEEVARDAGVGIGTLYRHFPTRDALVEQVYRDEAQQLAEAARRLAAGAEPLEALRGWLRLFVDYLATKRSMAELLRELPGGPAELYATSTALVRDSVTLLVDRAVASGAARVEVEPLDLLRALAGVANVSSGANWADNARNLVDILVAGIRTVPTSA
jgi:AcrR family transcriptional regulator